MSAEAPPSAEEAKVRGAFACRVEFCTCCARDRAEAALQPPPPGKCVCCARHLFAFLTALSLRTTQQPTPVFGSGSTFGAGTGFAGFTGVSSSSAAAAPPAAEGAGDGEAADGGDDEAAAAEEECQAEFKPVVTLDEVETSTGEEDEECMVDL